MENNMPVPTQESSIELLQKSPQEPRQEFRVSFEVNLNTPDEAASRDIYEKFQALLVEIYTKGVSIEYLRSSRTENTYGKY